MAGSDAPTETGTISWYSAEKGFGFITPEGGGPDVVVYPATLKAAGIEAVEAGDAVSFTAEPYRLARKAVSIKLT
jgi:CspA family cold shock protein